MTTSVDIMGVTPQRVRGSVSPLPGTDARVARGELVAARAGARARGLLPARGARARAHRRSGPRPTAPRQAVLCHRRHQVFPPRLTQVSYYIHINATF